MWRSTGGSAAAATPPGRVLADLAVMLADGGEAISDLAVLRDQGGLFGPVASTATSWRVLAGVDDDALHRVRTARAQARARGRQGGRPPLLIGDQQRAARRMYEQQDMTREQIGEVLASAARPCTGPCTRKPHPCPAAAGGPQPGRAADPWRPETPCTGGSSCGRT